MGDLSDICNINIAGDFSKIDNFSNEMIWVIDLISIERKLWIVRVKWVMRRITSAINMFNKRMWKTSIMLVILVMRVISSLVAMVETQSVGDGGKSHHNIFILATPGYFGHEALLKFWKCD